MFSGRLNYFGSFQTVEKAPKVLKDSWLTDGLDLRSFRKLRLEKGVKTNYTFLKTLLLF